MKRTNAAYDDWRYQRGETKQRGYDRRELAYVLRIRKRQHWKTSVIEEWNLRMNKKMMKTKCNWRRQARFGLAAHRDKGNKWERGNRMPRIYLSPSLQENNLYVNGGTEEEITNLIADAMEPYLLASGIEFVRNRPEMSLGEAIAASNAGDFDLHVAIHTNAAPESLSGKLQGVDAYYFFDSRYGREMAELVAARLREIYPDTQKVNTVPTATLRELRRTYAPTVLVEVGYHDNIEDAQWIKENIESIGRALAQSVTDYFGIPFQEPMIE